MKTLAVVLGLAFALLTLVGCSTLPRGSSGSSSVVGVWLVHDVDAPFPYHMYVFNSDGTLQQANPDAGDPNSSDSDGKGIWLIDGGRIKGKWVEVTADRATHKFTGRAEISFEITVKGDVFDGKATARTYDPTGTLTDGPTAPGKFEGKRVTYP